MGRLQQQLIASSAPDPAVLSSDVLLRRPDVLVAEHELIAASGDHRPAHSWDSASTTRGAEKGLDRRSASS